MKIIHSLKTIFADDKNKHATGIELIKQRRKICHLNIHCSAKITQHFVFKQFLTPSARVSSFTMRSSQLQNLIDFVWLLYLTKLI